MKKLSKKILIIVFLAVLIIVGCFVLFQKPEPAEAGWWDDTWLYRKPVAITNSSTAQTDFQVQITLDTASLITANTMQADCDDIRLTDINSNIIPHWMEPGTCNGASTKIWAKVPSIPASNATVYIYYGNPSAASESSVSDTFIREIAGVQGAWDMDGTGNIATNDTTADSSGNGNTGTASNVNTTGMAYADSQYAQGVDFDGTDDYINCGNDSSLDITDAITIEAWVKRNSSLNNFNSIAAKGAIEGYGFWFYIRAAGVPYLAIGKGDAATYTNHAYGSGFPADIWTQLVFVYNTGTGKVYKNGDLVNTYTDYPAVITIDNKPLKIGEISHCPAWQFPGSIDGVKIYNRALSAEEITDLYGTGGDRQGYVTTNYPNKSLVRKFSASVTIGSPGTQEKGPGPVGYWSFDEGYGDTTYDSSDNSNDGTRGGGTAAYKPTWQDESMCVSGKCLHFDGTDDYVDCGSDSSLNITDAITISAWVKISVKGDWNGVLDKCKSDNTEKTYRFHLNDSVDQKIRFAIWGSGDSFISEVYSNDGFPIAGQWTHIVGVYTGSELQLYIDGVKQTDEKTGLPCAAIGTNNYPLVLGAIKEGSSNYFNGSIDEVRIYPYARTAAQIRKDYNAGLAGMGGGTEGVNAALGGGGSQKWMTDGLVGYWKMDETSWTGVADEVVDASGAENHGVSACDGGGCSKPTTGAGKFGKGGVFDGTDDYVNAGSGTSLNITGDLTLEAWVKISSLATTQGIISTSNTAEGDSEAYSLWIMGSDVVFYQGDLTNRSSVAMTPDPPTNEWIHVVAVRDGADLQFYMNGATRGNGTLTVNPTSLTKCLIGALKEAASTWSFNGSIDQVRIYNRALSPKEVRDLYNFAPGPVLHLKMDEKVSGNAQTLYDISTNENNGTTYHGANAAGMDCTVPGKFGTACEFDGVDDYVSVNDFAY